MYTHLGLYIDGKWNHGNGAAARTSSIRRRRSRSRTCRMRSDGRSRRGARRRREGLQDLEARSRPTSAPSIIARPPTWCASAPTQIAKRDDAGAGQDLRRGQGRGASPRRHHRMVRRGRPPRLRPHHPGPQPTACAKWSCTEPVGVVAAFTPWNFPVADAGAQDRGALAAGCSIIIKASEETPGALRRAGEVLRGCGRAGRRHQSRVRRAGEDLRAPDRLADRAQDFVHRLGAGRQASRRSSPPRA